MDSVMDQFNSVFFSLSKYPSLYDHWLRILYDPDGGLVEHEWNLANLKKMQQDAQSMNILFTI